MEPTYRRSWAGALLFFTLFIGLFVAGEMGPDLALVHFLRAVALAAAVALFCIGWSLRQRERDEPAMRLILAEREHRLFDEHYNDAA